MTTGGLNCERLEYKGSELYLNHWITALDRDLSGIIA